MLRSILFCIFLAPILGFTQIYEIDDLASFEERLTEKDVDSSVLVLFDVDETLITPKDAILKKCNANIAQKLLREYHISYDIDFKSFEYFLSIIFAAAQFELVNDKSVALVYDLQERGIPTLAFTAAGTGKFGIIEKLENWRFDQLKNLGLDFQSFLGPLCLHWDAQYPEKAPLFFRGILFSSNQPKGIVLAEFLQKIKGNFSKIIMIDDKSKFLESVERSSQKENIPFEGYLYHEYCKYPCPIDLEVAQYQFKTLIEEERWLSDKEVKSQ